MIQSHISIIDKHYLGVWTCIFIDIVASAVYKMLCYAVTRNSYPLSFKLCRHNPNACAVAFGATFRQVGRIFKTPVYVQCDSCSQSATSDTPPPWWRLWADTADRDVDTPLSRTRTMFISSFLKSLSMSVSTDKYNYSRSCVSYGQYSHMTES